MPHTNSKDSGHSGPNQQQPLPSYREGSSASHRGSELDPKLSPQSARKELRDYNTRERRRPPAQTQASSDSSAEHKSNDAKVPEDALLIVDQNSELLKKIKDRIEVENSLDVLARQTISHLKAEVEMLKKEKEQAEKRNKELQEALRVTRKEKRDAEKRKEELQEALRAAKEEKKEAEEQRNRAEKSRKELHEFLRAAKRDKEASENMNKELRDALQAAVQKCWELNTRLGDSLEAQRMLKEQLAGMIPIRLQGEAGGTTGASKRGFLASIPWNKYREAVEEYKHSHRNPKER